MTVRRPGSSGSEISLNPLARTRNACRPAETFVNASLPDASVTPRRTSSSQMIALGSLVMTRDGEVEVAADRWRVCEFALAEQEKRTTTTAMTKRVWTRGRHCKALRCFRVLIFPLIAYPP